MKLLHTYQLAVQMVDEMVVTKAASKAVVRVVLKVGHSAAYWVGLMAALKDLS